ncbi:MAG: hypothetical protein ABR602_05345, partial [Gemmatimonadales bacterium]
MSNSPGEQDERGGAGASPRSSYDAASGAPSSAGAPPAAGSRGRPAAWVTALEGWGAVGVHTVAAILAALAVGGDAATAGITFLPLYALPVALASWGLGRAPGLAWAALVTGLALWVEAAGGGSDPVVVVWNVMAGLILLAAVAVGVSALRTSADFVRT